MNSNTSNLETPERVAVLSHHVGTQDATWSGLPSRRMNEYLPPNQAPPRHISIHLLMTWVLIVAALLNSPQPIHISNVLKYLATSCNHHKRSLRHRPAHALSSIQSFLDEPEGLWPWSTMCSGVAWPMTAMKSCIQDPWMTPDGLSPSRDHVSRIQHYLTWCCISEVFVVRRCEAKSSTPSTWRLFCPNFLPRIFHQFTWLSASTQ